jgi:hypothetical protein
MAELFGIEVPTINYHLKEIFQSGELQEDSVIRKIRITADDGKNYLTSIYEKSYIPAINLTYFIPVSKSVLCKLRSRFIFRVLPLLKV